MFSLKGKTVVVTGGGRGIGRGITRAMAKAGANVVVTGRSAGPLAEAVAEVRAMGGNAVDIAGDICSMDHINAVVKKAVDTYGYIDCWVNNAGSANVADVGPLINMTEQQYDNVVNLNMKWAFFGCQAAARSGSQPCPMTGQYGGAKAGLENMTATMAVEWGHKNIRVNAVAPGVVLTEHNGSTSMKNASRMRRQIETVPLRRLGHVDDVAHLCVYFAADESQWVSGQVVQVTGGSRIPVGLLTYLWKTNKDMEEREAGAAGAAE